MIGEALQTTRLHPVRVIHNPASGGGTSEEASSRAALGDMESGEATAPYLRISPATLTPEIAEQFDIPTERGVLVASVDPDGPAGEAGIEPRSVIVALGDAEILDSADLISALRDYRPGDSVELTVASGGEERQVTVELGERSQ